MEPLIRFQCWGRSPGDEGGERERDLMMGLESVLGESWELLPGLELLLLRATSAST